MLVCDSDSYSTVSAAFICVYLTRYANWTQYNGHIIIKFKPRLPMPVIIPENLSTIRLLCLLDFPERKWEISCLDFRAFFIRRSFEQVTHGLQSVQEVLANLL